MVGHSLIIMQAQRALQQLQQQQQQQQQQSSPAVRGSSPQRNQELPDYNSEPAAPQRHYAMHVSVGLAALCAWWYYLQDVPALERKLLSVLLTPVSTRYKSNLLCVSLLTYRCTAIASTSLCQAFVEADWTMWLLSCAAL